MIKSKQSIKDVAIVKLVRKFARMGEDRYIISIPQTLIRAGILDTDKEYLIEIKNK